MKLKTEAVTTLSSFESSAKIRCSQSSKMHNCDEEIGENSCTIKPNFIALISPETLVYNPQIVFTMWIFIIIQVVVKNSKRERKSLLCE